MLGPLLELLTPAPSANMASAKAPEDEAAPETIPEVVPNDLEDGLPSLKDLLGGDDE